MRKSAWIFLLLFLSAMFALAETVQEPEETKPTPAVPSADTIETYMKGTRALAEGKYALAIKHLGQCRELAPEDCAIQLQLGKAYLAIGSFGRALDEGLAARTCNNLDGEAERFLGRVYMMFSLRGDAAALHKAAEVLTQGTALYPDNFGLWAELGEIRIAMGEHRQALEAYQKLRELVVTPSYPLLDRIQELNRLLGDDQQRAEVLWDMLRFFGDQNGESRELESIYLMSGDKQGRENLYATLLSWNPGDTSTRMSLAEMQAAAGNLEEALRTLDKEPNDPPPPQLDALRASFLIAGHRQRQGARIIEKLLQHAPDNQLLLLEYGNLLLTNGHADGASEYFQGALAEGMSERRLHDLSSRLLAAEGPDMLFKVIEPHVRCPHLDYLAFLSGHGDLPAKIPAGVPKPGIAELNSASHESWTRALGELSDEEDKSLWLAWLADVLPPKEALHLVQSWHRENSPRAAVVSLLARIAEKAGDQETARSAHLELVKEQPENPWVLNNAGYYLATRSNRLEEALPLLEKALELDPESPWILDSLGWAYWLSGDETKAKSLLEKAWHNSLDSPTIADHIKTVTGRKPKKP